MFSGENMAGTPRVRSFKDENTYSLQDSKLAESWTSKLEEDAIKGAYRRDIPSAEIEARGREVKLTFQLNPPKEESPMGNRLEHNYSNASAQNLENELKCHLPLSVVAMRAASLEDWTQFRQIKVLLAVLLPPFIRGGKKVLPCFRSGGGILKGNAILALGIFKRNARLLLEYLGCHNNDVYDIEYPEAEPSRYVEGAGSAATFFIIGPFLLSKAHRQRHGKEGFSSIFYDENTQNPAAKALGVYD
jgi:hypothetical protein